MSKSKVSIVKYEEPLESVRKLVELTNLFDEIPKDAKVFIKQYAGFVRPHLLHKLNDISHLVLVC